MSKKITEGQMIDNLVNALTKLSEVEFTEEYNRMMGTDYIVEEVDFEAD